MKAHQIAMLNPRGASITGGAGGVPDITPQDIAGEMARFQDRPIEMLALCLRWWPGGVAGCRHHAEMALSNLAHDKYRKYQAHVLDVKLCLELARTDGNRSGQVLLERRLDCLRRESWPEPREGRYLTVFRGAFAEFAKPLHCKTCGGSGQTPATETTPTKTCKNCGGSGNMSRTNNARACLCGIHHHAFEESWATVYIWTLGVMGRALNRAVKTMAQDSTSQQDLFAGQHGPQGLA